MKNKHDKYKRKDHKAKWERVEISVTFDKSFLKRLIKKDSINIEAVNLDNKKRKMILHFNIAK